MVGLVADIGSTNARFALAAPGAGSPILSHTAVLPCRDFPTLEDALERYLAGLPPAQRPCAGTLAVAAPVTGDAITLTNNKWRFSLAALKTRFGFEQLFAINDFTAISLSLLNLPPEACATVGPAADLTRAKTVGVIGPGSGLGVGGLLHPDGVPFPVPSEGGHMSFAPQTDVEWAVAGALSKRFGHVSNERLLSGPGIANIHQALCEIGGRPAEPLEPAEIVARGISGENPTCRESMELFCAILGSAAGDLALLFYADTVFIAGGIVLRFVDFLRQSRFRARFEAKGRFAGHTANVPTLVVTEKYAGLIGAAVHLLQHRST